MKNRQIPGAWTSRAASERRRTTFIANSSLSRTTHGSIIGGHVMAFNKFDPRYRASSHPPLSSTPTSLARRSTHSICTQKWSLRSQVRSPTGCLLSGGIEVLFQTSRSPHSVVRRSSLQRSVQIALGAHVFTIKRLFAE